MSTCGHRPSDLDPDQFTLVHDLDLQVTRFVSFSMDLLTSTVINGSLRHYSTLIQNMPHNDNTFSSLKTAHAHLDNMYLAQGDIV
jgi:hypothetical protein